MGVYLLRVGADATHVGGAFHSPIFKDRSYIFIPIPENKDRLIKSKALIYNDFKWHNTPVIGYLPKKIWNVDAERQYIHNDPEFETFTYGSPKRNKKGTIEKNYNSFLHMQRGDLLAFYAAFSNDSHHMSGLYFFAYFIVQCVTAYDRPDDLGEEERSLVKNNHHYIHGFKEQIIVKGDPDQSKVFHKAVLLSLRSTDRIGSNYYPCPVIQENLGGYYKSMNLSSIRKINSPEIARSFKQYLDSQAI